jgi:NADH:ubiquinone oxidoreductase subunit 6 (subunit J)
MLLGAIGLGAVVCGLAAIRAARLAIGALWLAGASACVAGLLYLLGAREIAVIELSVGISLVTVLLVYGIAMVGETRRPPWPVPPWRYAATLAVLVFVLATTLALPAAVTPRPEVGEALAVTLWSRRGLDALVQVVLICIGALGVLMVLAVDRAPATAGWIAAARHAPSPSGEHAASVPPPQEARR